MSRVAGLKNSLKQCLSGVLAVLCGLSVGELVALPLSVNASPFYAVGGFTVDHSPAPVREWAIDTFGTNDKLVLFAGMGLAIAVLAALTGVLEARRRPLGSVVIAIFGAVGVAAALARPTSTIWYAVPSIVTAVVGIAALTLLVRSASRAGTASDAGVGRRRFLVVAGSVAAVAAAGLGLRGILAKRISASTERAKLTLPAAGDVAPPVPNRIDYAPQGGTTFVTNSNEFYRIDTALQVPSLTTSEWELRISGMVDKPITLTWDDLLRQPVIERYVTLCCVSNEVGGPLAGNAKWLGVHMAPILKSAGLDPSADMLLSTSVDGWTSGTPLAEILDGRDAMLAFGMNGEPLPAQHGYPVRQVIPGLYGYVSATKWVTEWKVTRFADDRAYWTDRGWDEKGPIKTSSRIDSPGALARVPRGLVTATGTAWAQHRGITRVEVKVDDGPWVDAVLAQEYSKDTWRQWTYSWNPEPGQHIMTCRATDGTGAVQVEERVPPIPGGATGWHTRVFRVE